MTYTFKLGKGCSISSQFLNDGLPYLSNGLKNVLVIVIAIALVLQALKSDKQELRTILVTI